jgi:predicted alpha/beta hydrolase family esterase
MTATTLLIVHGFAVIPHVFQTLLRRLHDRSLEPVLFGYPSVGLPLQTLIDRLSEQLRSDPPSAIIAHSLGCMVTSEAILATAWSGPLILLAPPFATLPATRRIPRFMRWPFGPLIDHCLLTSSPHYQPPVFPGCRVKSIAGRFDLTVPLRCTRNKNVEEYCVLNQTHNSLLFSSAVVDLCADWIARFEALETGE